MQTSFPKKKMLQQHFLQLSNKGVNTKINLQKMKYKFCVLVMTNIKYKDEIIMNLTDSKTLCLSSLYCIRSPKNLKKFLSIVFHLF